MTGCSSSSTTAPSIRPDKLLVASGRSGNTETLDLDAAGVEVNHAGDHRRRVVRRRPLRTCTPPATSSDPRRSRRRRWSRAASLPAGAFGIDFKELVDPSPPTGVYSIPEIAAVGLTEQAAADTGFAYEVGRGRFETNSRANISGATEGTGEARISRVRTARSSACHILGDNATEAIHVGQAAIKTDQSIDYFIDTTFNVPTLCEAYKYAAYDGLQRLQETS